MLEKSVEQKLKNEVEALGCLCLKLSILGWRGWNDRLILGPNRVILFFEVKRPGKVARKNQNYIHRVLRKFGFDVHTIDDWEDALPYVRKALKMDPP